MKRRILNITLVLTALEGLCLTGVFLARHDLFAGPFLSADDRWIPLLFWMIALAITLVFGVLSVQAHRKPLLYQRVRSVVNHEKWALLLTIAFAGIFYESVQNVVYLYSDLQGPAYLFRFNLKVLRLISPFLYWGIAFSLQSLLTLLFLRPKVPFKKINDDRLFWNSILVFIILLILWGSTAFTDVGFMTLSDPAQRPTYGRFLPLKKPLPGVQAAILLAFLWLVFYGAARVGQGQSGIKGFFRHQGFIYLLIWAAAFFLWLDVPVEPNYALDMPAHPSGAIYPSSDAFYFDKEAHRVLVGEGFEASSTHAMYSFFLSGMHLLVGDAYRSLITVQYLFLALVPVLLYQLTKKLHTQFSGLLAAFLYILRERNGLILGAEQSGALLNQLISENLALVGVIIFFYLMWMWAERPGRRKTCPLLAGGVMGITMLIRAELAAMLVAVVAGALVALWHRKREWLRGTLFLLGIVGVIITPWMVRNWQKTGVFSLDKGNFVKRRLADYSGYIFSGDGDLENERDPQTEGSPPSRLSVMVNHAGNNFQQTILYLPSNHQPVMDGVNIYQYRGKGKGVFAFLGTYFSESFLDRYTRSLPYYWNSWEGQIPARSIFPLVIALFLTAVGIGLSWRRSRAFVILALPAFFAHIMIWSFARFSGSRFVKLTDWMTLVLWAVGLSAGALSILGSLDLGWGRKPAAPASEDAPSPSPPQPLQGLLNAGLALILVGVGVGPVLAERGIPPRYTEEKLDRRLDDILIMETGPSRQAAEWIAEIRRDERGVYYGKALYPRYFEKGAARPDDRRGSMPDPYGSRIDFYLVGMKNIWVSLPTTDPDLVFQHPVDVMVEGRMALNTAADLIDGDYKPYLLAERVYVFQPAGGGETVEVIPCSGSMCRSGK